MGAPEPLSPELLGTEQPEASDEVTSNVDLASRRRPITVAVVALASIALAAVALWPTGDGEAVTPPPTTAPDGRIPALAAAPRLPGDGDGLDATPEIAGLDTDPWDIAPITRGAFGLQAVVTSQATDEAALVSVGPDGDLGSTDLPEDLGSYTFDASGGWLAGIGTTQYGPPRRVLWVGPTAGELEPVAVDVRSYAWHETDPGRIAWSFADQAEISTLDFMSRLDIVTVEPTIRGRVRGWGDWGYALETSGSNFTTSVLDPAGQPIALDVPGRFSGNLGGGRLLFSGARTAEPMIVDAATGELRPVGWLGADDYIWSMTASPTGDVAALIGRGGLRADPFQAELTRLAADGALEVLGATDSFTHLAWTPDGSGVVVALQDPANDVPPRIVALDGGGAQAPMLDVPNLFDGAEWVAAVRYLELGP